MKLNKSRKHKIIIFEKRLIWTEENVDGDIDDLVRAEFTLAIFPGTKKIIFMRHENIFMKALMTLKSYAKNFIKETNTL